MSSLRQQKLWKYAYILHQQHINIKQRKKLKKPAKLCTCSLDGGVFLYPQTANLHVTL